MSALLLNTPATDQPPPQPITDPSWAPQLATKQNQLNQTRVTASQTSTIEQQKTMFGGLSPGQAMAAALKLNVSLPSNVFGLSADLPVLQGNPPWTTDEDASLLATVLMYTDKDWNKVEKLMNNGRTAAECAARSMMINQTPLRDST